MHSDTCHVPPGRDPKRTNPYPYGADGLVGDDTWQWRTCRGQSHQDWQATKAPEVAERFAGARRNAEQSIASRRPYINPELEAQTRAEYRREAELHILVEDLASRLLDVAGELGWGSGEPAVDAHDWLHRVAVERGLAIAEPEPRPLTRREEANRATQKAFRRIGERDGFRCRICGADRTLTVDHIAAVFNDGDDEDENFQLLCRSCNSRKGTSR